MADVHREVSENIETNVKEATFDRLFQAFLLFSPCLGLRTVNIVCRVLFIYLFF